MFTRLYLIVLLFSYCFISTHANPPATLTPPLSIVTYNVANYMDVPNWENRLDLIVNEIEQIHADVIILQEIRFNPDEVDTQSDYNNMAEQLLRKLNARGDFLTAQLVTQPAMYYPVNTLPASTHNFPLPASLSPNHASYYWEGLSIISKPKIIETGSYFLSKPNGCNDGNKRITQYAKIDNAGQLFYIANAHFGLGAVCIAANVKETVGYLQTFNKNTPLLLAGDLNITPDDPNLILLKEMGLTDLWAKLYPGVNGYTFPTSNPIKRIDFMWANAALLTQLSEQTQMKLIGGQPQNGLYPSDHLGVGLIF